MSNYFTILNHCPPLLVSNWCMTPDSLTDLNVVTCRGLCFRPAPKIIVGSTCAGLSMGWLTTIVRSGHPAISVACAGWVRMGTVRCMVTVAVSTVLADPRRVLGTPLIHHWLLSSTMFSLVDCCNCYSLEHLLVRHGSQRGEPARTNHHGHHGLFDLLG